jgi:ABC-2 type transport system ATP-binding protein
VVAETRVPAAGIAQVPGTHRVDVTGGRVSFDVDTADLGEAIAALGGYGLLALTSHPPTLEELFLRHYDDSLEER